MRRVSKIELILISVLSLVTVGASLGQITGNLNSKDPRAITITSEKVDLLCGKKWRSLKVFEKRREREREYLEYPREVSTEFALDGGFKKVFSGTWKNIANSYILISVNPERKEYRNHLFEGAFSLYEISDSTLVLGQVLTSSGDWLKEYHFINPKKGFAQDQYLNEGRRFGTPNPIDSLKSGKLVMKDDKGRVSSIEYYEKGSPRRTWTTYFSDGTIQETAHYNENGEYQMNDQYEYGKGRALPLIHRRSRNLGNLFIDDPVFIIGNKDSISFDRVNFNNIKIAGSYNDEKIKVKNLSENPVELVLLPNSKLGVTTTSVRLQPDESIEVDIKVKIPAGPFDGVVSIKSDEWVLDLDFHSFGYHMTVADFESAGRKEFSTKFYYYRTADEYQMEIQDLDKRSKTNHIPISNQMNEIELKKGLYRLTILGTFGKKTTEIAVK